MSSRLDVFVRNVTATPQLHCYDPRSYTLKASDQAARGSIGVVRASQLTSAVLTASPD
jgi:hypothetical protein